MKYEQYENEERFAALERRVEKLEATIIKLLAQAKTSEKAIERNEMREWNNHLGIATVADVYSGRSKS